jgi:hypothetical protein
VFVQWPLAAGHWLSRAAGDSTLRKGHESQAFLNTALLASANPFSPAAGSDMLPAYEQFKLEPIAAGEAGAQRLRHAAPAHLH